MASKSSDREIISPAPSPELPFSMAVAYNGLLFVSGTVGRDPQSNTIASGDVRAQTRQALRRVQQQCELAGTSLDRALKLTIFLTDMSLFAAMNEAYREFFSANPPTRSCVEVTALPDREALVEIEAIVAR
jgi:2-iminobutanoate/2-iminopropanoate deaminase